MPGASREKLKIADNAPTVPGGQDAGREPVGSAPGCPAASSREAFVKGKAGAAPAMAPPRKAQKGLPMFRAVWTVSAKKAARPASSPSKARIGSQAGMMRFFQSTARQAAMAAMPAQ